MKLQKTTAVCLAAVAATVILAAVGWFLLPERVGMQLGLSGQLQNYMPKPLALLVPVGLSAVGAGLSAAETRRTAGLVLSLVAPALLAVMFVMNH